MKSIHNIPSHQPLLESHYTVPPPNYPYPPKSHLIIATTATLNKQTNKRFLLDLHLHTNKKKPKPSLPPSPIIIPSSKGPNTDRYATRQTPPQSSFSSIPYHNQKVTKGPSIDMQQNN